MVERGRGARRGRGWTRPARRRDGQEGRATAGGKCKCGAGQGGSGSAGRGEGVNGHSNGQCARRGGGGMSSDGEVELARTTVDAAAAVTMGEELLRCIGLGCACSGPAGAAARDVARVGPAAAKTSAVVAAALRKCLRLVLDGLAELGQGRAGELHDARVFQRPE